MMRATIALLFAVAIVSCVLTTAVSGASKEDSSAVNSSASTSSDQLVKFNASLLIVPCVTAIAVIAFVYARLRRTFQEPVLLLQGQDEAAAMVYAAQGDHEKAFHSYVMAAEYHREQAEALNEANSFLPAAKSYAAAAAMYAAAGVRERQVLASILATFGVVGE